MASAWIYFIFTIGLQRADHKRQTACKGCLLRQILFLICQCKEFTKRAVVSLVWDPELPPQFANQVVQLHKKSKMLPLMLMSCSYRSVQCMALLRGRRPDLMDLGHILLNLLDPTPAPIILLLAIIPLRLIFNAVTNFLQGSILSCNSQAAPFPFPSLLSASDSLGGLVGDVVLLYWW